MMKRGYAPIQVQGTLAAGRTREEIESTGNASTAFFTQKAAHQQAKRANELLGKPVAMPDSIWLKRDTHLLGWMMEASYHLRRGSKLWCESYLTSAREYYFAMCRDLGIPVTGSFRDMFDFAPKMWDFVHGELRDEHAPEDFSFDHMLVQIVNCERMYLTSEETGV